MVTILDIPVPIRQTEFSPFPSKDLSSGETDAQEITFFLLDQAELDPFNIFVLFDRLRCGHRVMVSNKITKI